MELVNVEPCCNAPLSICDNAVLYKAFPPMETRRILKKLEIHYTPKHGSWLDITEIELNVMTRQCLSQRIASIDMLHPFSAWENGRKHDNTKMNRQFTATDALIKLIALHFLRTLEKNTIS